MSERTPACRFVASDMPRIVKGRHVTECADDECWGCQPCAEDHCNGDACRGRNHALTTCADCLTAARDDLAAIRVMCGMPLLEEVLSGNAESEAAMLLGPAANTTAWGHRAMSAMMGRVDDAYLEDCRDEAHPLWTLTWIENEWREALDQPTDLRATIPRAGDYIGRTMHVVAGMATLPNGDQPPEFADAARRLRQCRAHLEDVLHDGIREEKGAPCPDCGKALVKTYGARVVDDRWKCPARCKVSYTEGRYRGVVDDDYLANAEALTASDMHRAHGVPAGSVRGWATLRPGEEKPRVAKRGKDANGLQLYDVADVLAQKAQRAEKEPA